MALPWDDIQITLIKSDKYIVTEDETIYSLSAEQRFILFTQGENSGSGSNRAVWGKITGVLADQVDLQNALNKIIGIENLGELAFENKNYLNWRNITGVVSSNYELQSAFDEKLDITDFTDFVEHNAVDYETQVINKPNLGLLAPKDNIDLNSTDTTGILPIAKGGTGATSLAALANIILEKKVFYVDGVNGNDSNDGSSENPFQTIQHAVDMIPVEGDIYVAAGTYYESVVISNKIIKLIADEQGVILESFSNISLYARSALVVINNAHVMIDDYWTFRGFIPIHVKSASLIIDIWTWIYINKIINPDYPGDPGSGPFPCGICIEYGNLFVRNGNLDITVRPGKHPTEDAYDYCIMNYKGNVYINNINTNATNVFYCNGGIITHGTVSSSNIITDFALKTNGGQVFPGL